MSSKENIAPASSRKSKIPVPKFVQEERTRGVKRGISSPNTAVKRSTPDARRKVLSDLPTNPKNVTKVQIKGKKQRPVAKTKVIKDRKVRFASQVKCEIIPTDKDMEFKEDASSLAGILSETGIPDTALHNRYTLATTPTASSSRSSMAPPGRVSMINFTKTCNDFLQRTAQPALKRQRTDVPAKDIFNTKLTPSKIDFCSKYGVSKASVFAMPPTRSVLARTPMRIATPSNTQRSDAQPLNATPRDVDVDPGMKTPQQSGCQAVIPGRFSLAAQTPGRVASTKPVLSSAALFGVPGLTASMSQDQAMSEKAPLFDNSNLSPRTKSYVQQQLAKVKLEPDVNKFDFNTPQKVVKSEKGIDNVFGRPSLAAQTPGRVSKHDAENKLTNDQFFGRPSLAAHTPMRVMKSDNSQIANNNPNDLFMGRPSFAAQTPGRIFMPENDTDIPLAGRPSLPGRVLKQSVTQTHLPGGIGRPSITVTDVVSSSRALLQFEVDESAMGTPPAPMGLMALQTPQRVPRQLALKQSETGQQPGRVATPTKVTTNLINNASSPNSTPLRVTRQSVLKQMQLNSAVGTPGRVATPRAQHSIPAAQTPTTKVQGQNSPSMSMQSRGAKQPRSPTGADNNDIRRYWKTKKTPNTSPVLKEVLSAQTDTCEKKMTWADVLNKDDGLETSEATSVANHDDMQDNSSEEKTISSPSSISQNSLATTTTTSCTSSAASMQLPVIFPVPSSAVATDMKCEADSENGNQLEPIQDSDLLHLPESLSDNVTQQSSTTMPSSESPPSLTHLTQPQLGHHHSSVDSLGNRNMPDALYHDKIAALVQQKQRELAELQSQIETLVDAKERTMNQPLDFSHVANAKKRNMNQTSGFDHEANTMTTTGKGLTDVDNAMSLDNSNQDPVYSNSHSKDVTNTEYTKHNININTSQMLTAQMAQGKGQNFEVDLDVNSNMAASGLNSSKSITPPPGTYSGSELTDCVTNSSKNVASPPGTYSGSKQIDCVTNMVFEDLDSANYSQDVDTSDSSPLLLGSHAHTADFTTPTKQMTSIYQNDEDNNITPYILRDRKVDHVSNDELSAFTMAITGSWTGLQNSGDSMINKPSLSCDFETDNQSDVPTNCGLKTDVHLDHKSDILGHKADILCHKSDILTVTPPLWTPMALRSVAKRTTGSPAVTRDLRSNDNDVIATNSKFIAKPGRMNSDSGSGILASEGLVPSEVNFVHSNSVNDATTSKASLQTMPNDTNDTTAALYAGDRLDHPTSTVASTVTVATPRPKHPRSPAVPRTHLTPRVGSMSLKANTGTKNTKTQNRNKNHSDITNSPNHQHGDVVLSNKKMSAKKQILCTATAHHSRKASAKKMVISSSSSGSINKNGQLLDRSINSHGKSLDEAKSSSLRKDILTKTNERYQEAVLDNEVELFLCRLVNQQTTASSAPIRCYNPIAHVLEHGDDMHFIPVEETVHRLPSNINIRGSAFTKVISTRST